MQNEPDSFLTALEAAQRFGYHVEHVKRLLRANMVEAKRNGENGVWLVSLNSLRAYAERRAREEVAA